VAASVRLLLAALTLSCGGGPSAPSPTPSTAATDALYEASARDYGFDFDGQVWEVERLPQCSLVRECLHPDVMSRSFFTIGCWGDLTRVRGFEYSWQLQSGPVPCRLDPSKEDRERLLAFTHEPTAGELPQRMLRAWIGPGSFQWSGEAKTDIELARQHLGHWPTTTR